MAREGTLADPPGVPSCAVCGGADPNCTNHQFEHAPYPDDYPFLPGGYDRNGDQNVTPRPLVGARRRKLRFR